MRSVHPYPTSDSIIIFYYPFPAVGPFYYLLLCRCYREKILYPSCIAPLASAHGFGVVLSMKRVLARCRS